MQCGERRDELGHAESGEKRVWMGETLLEQNQCWERHPHQRAAHVLGCTNMGIKVNVTRYTVLQTAPRG